MDCLVLACKMTQKPSRVDRSREYPPPSPYTHTQSGTLTLPSDLFTQFYLFTAHNVASTILGRINLV